MAENEFLERRGYNDDDADSDLDSDEEDNEERKMNKHETKSAPKMLWQLSVCFLGSQSEAENYRYTFKLNQNNEASEDAQRNGIGKVCMIDSMFIIFYLILKAEFCQDTNGGFAFSIDEISPLGL